MYAEFHGVWAVIWLDHKTLMNLGKRAFEKAALKCTYTHFLYCFALAAAASRCFACTM